MIAHMFIKAQLLPLVNAMTGQRRIIREKGARALLKGFFELEGSTN